MARNTKRQKQVDALLEDKEHYYSLEEAVDLLKKCPELKFDQSVDLSFRMGVDPKKSDQQIRATVNLPHGSGKKVVIVALTRGDKVEEAKKAGADFAGHDELIDKIKGGWTAFDALVVTPDMMREVGKLGKILGPRGLMPSPKTGTVTNDLEKIIKEIKAGKIEFKLDKSGVINCLIGKISFPAKNIIENVKTLIKAIVRAKPTTAKGSYISSIVISTTMGPGIKLDLTSLV